MGKVRGNQLTRSRRSPKDSTGKTVVKKRFFHLRLNCIIDKDFFNVNSLIISVLNTHQSLLKWKSRLHLTQLIIISEIKAGWSKKEDFEDLDDDNESDDQAKKGPDGKTDEDKKIKGKGKPKKMKGKLE